MGAKQRWTSQISGEVYPGTTEVRSDTWNSFGYGIKRDDPLLVQVVRELGEAANGACAELDIVSVPDDASWEISEYDGNEHIAEKHRTWY